MDLDTAISRRTAFKGAAGGAAALGLAKLATAPTAKAADPWISKGSTKIIVIGSQGGQQMTQLTGAALRCGTSVLIDVGGSVTVLDCGCGSAHRIVEAGYDLNRVSKVLITHCHFDHVADLGSLMGFGWSSGRNGGEPDRRMKIYGPTGVEDYLKGYKRSIRLSIADQEGPLGQVPTFDKFARVHQFNPPKRAKGVYEDDRIEVTTIRVNHGSMPSVGYRIRTPDVDMVFSGDRGIGEDNFNKFSKGATVMFHEIIDRELVVNNLTAQGAAPTFIDHLVNDHSDPETVGRTATEAGIGTLVLYHLIPGNVGLTDAYWKNLMAPYYDGLVIVAKDLLVV